MTYLRLVYSKPSNSALPVTYMTDTEFSVTSNTVFYDLDTLIILEPILPSSILFCSYEKSRLSFHHVTNLFFLQPKTNDHIKFVHKNVLRVQVGRHQFSDFIPTSSIKHCANDTSNYIWYRNIQYQLFLSEGRRWFCYYQIPYPWIILFVKIYSLVFRLFPSQSSKNHNSLLYGLQINQSVAQACSLTAALLSNILFAYNIYIKLDVFLNIFLSFSFDGRFWCTSFKSSFLRNDHRLQP